MMSRVAFLLFMAAECVAPPPQVREVVLRVVRDVYREEGISIRHLGSISNLARPETALLEPVFQVRSGFGFGRFLRIENVERQDADSTIFSIASSQLTILLSKTKQRNPPRILRKINEANAFAGPTLNPVFCRRPPSK